MNFKSLEMELLLPARAFAGETLPLSVRIRNHRRLFPAFSLQTEPPGNGLYFAVIQPRGIGRARRAKRSLRGADVTSFEQLAHRIALSLRLLFEGP